MGKKNIDVVKAWSRGYPASSHNGNFRTDGMGLWSYNLLIGATVAGEKVLALYRASGEYKSQTTSQHVARAQAYSDKAIHPAIFRQYKFDPVKG